MSPLAFGRLALAISAAVFLGGGLLFLVDPELVSRVGIRLEGPDARNDFRAVYGGIEIGLGVFLALCLRGEGRVHIGLVLGALVFAAMVLSRAYSVVLDGAPSSFVWWLTAFEAAGGGLCATALGLLFRAEQGASEG